MDVSWTFHGRFMDVSWTMEHTFAHKRHGQQPPTFRSADAKGLFGTGNVFRQQQPVGDPVGFGQDKGQKGVDPQMAEVQHFHAFIVQVSVQPPHHGRIGAGPAVVQVVRHVVVTRPATPTQPSETQVKHK